MTKNQNRSKVVSMNITEHQEIDYHEDQMVFDFHNEDNSTEEKFWYDSYTGTYWLSDEEWEEPMEFTEDELIQEGIYINEFNQRV